MSRRRRRFGVTNLLSDIVDDIRDFVDDGILDRRRYAGRDVSQVGRNRTDGFGLGSAPAPQQGSADLDDLRSTIRELAEKMSSLAAEPASAEPASVKPAAEPVPAKPAADPGAVAKAVAAEPEAVAQLLAAEPAAVAEVVAAEPEAVAKVVEADPEAVAKVATAEPGAVAKIAAAEPGTVAKIAAAAPASATQAAPAKKPEVKVPWPGYDGQTVVQVRKNLVGASASKIRAVLGYETANKNRRGVTAAAEAALDS